MVDPPPPPRYLDARTEFAHRFLSGEGLEIGAPDRPLPLPPGASSRQVDREAPATLADASQDFIVADHLLGVADDPVDTIAAHLAKLRPGGVLLYTVPARVGPDSPSGEGQGWDEAALLELLLRCRARAEGTLLIEAVARSGEETVAVLRRAGAWPAPADTPTVEELRAETVALKAAVARLEASERELERLKHSSSWRVTEPLRAAKARLRGRR